MLFEHLPKELAKDAIAAPYHIYDAANCYKAIYSSLSPLMTTFITRFFWFIRTSAASTYLPALARSRRAISQRRARKNSSMPCSRF